MIKARKFSLLEKAALGVGTFLGLASGASAQEAKPIEGLLEGAVPYAQINEDSEGIFDGFIPYVETTFATNYVFGSGLIIGRENPKKHSGVNQTLFSLGKDNVLTEGDNVSPFIWTNFDFDDAKYGNGFNELDVGVDYTCPISKDLSATIGFCFWNYPNEDLGEHGDRMAHGKLSYNSIVDVEAGLMHLLAHEDVDNGEFYFIKASKTLPLGKLGDFDFSITPSYSRGFTDNFYGSYGYVTSTPGATLNVNNEKGEPFCNIFVRYQDGKGGVDDFTYGGITFPISLGQEE